MNQFAARDRLLDTIGEGQAMCKFLANDKELSALNRTLVEGMAKLFDALYDEFSGDRLVRQVMARPLDGETTDARKGGLSE